jgi:Protein of unknown function (DUF3157).
MVGMKTLLRAFVALVLVCTVNAFADDIMATASNGATVILHDNGRWEYYQNNSKIRDIRQSAIPEDAKFNVMVEYESPDRVRKNIRLAMEAEFATEEEIKDSLRNVPKGGYIYFQVKTSQIKKGMPRKLTYFLYDGGKNPILQRRLTIPKLFRANLTVFPICLSFLSMDAQNQMCCSRVCRPVTGWKRSISIFR